MVINGHKGGDKSRTRKLWEKCCQLSNISKRRKRGWRRGDISFLFFNKEREKTLKPRKTCCKLMNSL